MASKMSKVQSVNDSEGALEQALRTVSRHRLVFLQALIIVPLAALVLSLLQEKEYTATATLLFRQAPEGLLAGAGDTGFIDPAREAATNDELVGLPVVAKRAAGRLSGQVTPNEVFNSVSVDSGGEADIAKISATAGSADLAARMANAYGRAYIAFRRESDRSQVDQAIRLVRESIADLPPSEQAGPQGQELESRLNELELARSLQTGNAELVQEASPPSSQSSPKTRRNVVLGILLGGVLGFGLAALLERVDRRVRTVGELEELYELPVLARIPRSRSLTGARLNSGVPNRTPEAEAFRTLRANLRYFNVDRQHQSLLICSAAPGDGKSTVARQLATTMTQMGDSVVLVEADLHRGGTFVSATGNTPTGLSAALSGSPLEQCVVEVEAGSTESGSRYLTVLPSGPVPPNPSELLDSERMQNIVNQLQSRYDMVIIDSPALGVVSDALALVSDVSGIVVVGGLGHTTRDGGEDLLKQLSILGAQPLGVIANFTEPDRGEYAYYHRSDSAALS